MERRICGNYYEIYMPNHPCCHRGGYIYEHRVVAEKIVNRILLPEETVHHIDENGLNNDLSNLIIFRTNEDHSRYHKTKILVNMNDGTYISPESYNQIQCCNCGKYFRPTKQKQKFCSHSCHDVYRNKKSKIPSYNTLYDLIHSKSFTEIGKIYDVSDNTIRKWCKKYNLPHKHKDIFTDRKLPCNNTKKSRIDLNSFHVKIFNDNEVKIFDKIDMAIIFFKQFSKASDRNIRTMITNSVKHNKKIFNYNVEFISNTSSLN